MKGREKPATDITLEGSVSQDSESKPQGGLGLARDTAVSMLRSVPVAVVVHGPDGSILAANPMAEELLGAAEEELRTSLAGLDKWSFHNRDGSPMDEEEYPVSLVLQWKKPLRNHLVGFRRKDMGEMFWGLANADPVFGPDGAIDHVVVAFMTITEQKRAQDKVKESEARFRLIAETIRDVFWMRDLATGEMAYVSPAFEHVWGRTRASLYEKPMSFLDAVHPEDRRKLERAVDKGPEEPRTTEYRIIHPTGEVRWIRDRVFPVLNEIGQPTALVGVASDVTETVKARQESQAKTEMLQGLFDNLPVLVFVKDGRGRFRMVNRMFEEVHGRRQEDVAGRSHFELFPKPVADMFERDDQEVLTTGRALSVEEVIVLAGERRTFYTVKFPLSGGQGGPTGLCGISLDVTERRRAEDELLAAKDRAEAADRVKSRFLSTVRHEMNTPLNGILGMADLLSETGLDDEQKGYLQVLAESAENLRGLIGRVISFSELEKNAAKLEKEPFALQAVLESLAGTMSVLAARKGLEYKTEVAADVPPMLVGDAAKLKELLKQLLSNAVKFTLQGSVSLAVRRSPDQEGDGLAVDFTVKDTGVGIPDKDKEGIFEPFTQADGSLSRRFGGSGLGLSIARNLARAMEGGIRLRSRPGGGSEFTFTTRFEIADTLYK